jgi:endonuclease/exonuclease/phosphatase family metal-dependent hydrolase
LPYEGDDVPLHQPGSSFAVSDAVKDVIISKAQSLRQQGGYGDYRGRIAIFALLEDRTNPGRKVMVGTTHLDKSPDSSVKSLSRVKQMSVLNVIQGHLAETWGLNLDSDVVIFGGDLNTDMLEGTLVKQPALAGADHRLTELSVQPSMDSCTTLTEDRNMWIDYIFHAGQVRVTHTEKPDCPTRPIPNLNQPSDHFPVTARFEWRKGGNTPTQEVAIAKDYDFTRSTEENYAMPGQDNADFVGKYVKVREQLDYNYHTVYQKERQLLQDDIASGLLHTRVLDEHLNISCAAPIENWIVFTAGGMGAGKSHTIRWLHKQGYFPLKEFFVVDPDHIRSMLPETKTYRQLNASLS